jgi:O-antigen/teichoic acid export membrane protein
LCSRLSRMGKLFVTKHLVKDLIPRLSLRRNIVFSMVGRGYYAVTQFLVIVLAARLGSPEVVGVLTLASAIVTPMFFLATMGTHDVLTIDDLDRFSRADYVLLRLIGSVMAVVMSVLVTLVAYRDGGALILASVFGFSLVKFSSAQASMNHAMFQRAERLDFVAISIFMRSTAGLLAFGLAFWQTHNLPFALFCEAAAWFLSYWFVDRGLLTQLGLQTAMVTLSDTGLRRIGSLALWVLPVGIALWLMRVATSVPPIILEHYAGLAAVGVFGALAYVHTALSMLANAVGSASAARLRRYVREHRTTAFRTLARKLTMMSLLFGFVMTGLAWLVGAQLLTLVFGPEYGDRALFTIIVAASSLTLVASPLITAITATQAFSWRLAISGISLAAGLASALLLVPGYGIYGAAWSFVASSFAFLFVTLVACLFLMPGENGALSDG